MTRTANKEIQLFRPGLRGTGYKWINTSPSVMGMSAHAAEFR